MNFSKSLLRSLLSPVGAFPRNARGFTLLELLTVIAMIILIVGALTTAVGGAYRRAHIQKAQADVKSVTQAILGYENVARDHELPLMNNRDCDRSSLGFLLGSGGTSEYGDKIPVLLAAALASNGKMTDPWGTPYRITIRKGQVKFDSAVRMNSLSTDFVVPNFYRLTEGERQ